MEHFMLTVIAILVTIAVGILSVAAVSLRNWKKEFKEDNDKEHGEIWDRVNKHGHKIECPVNDCKPHTAGVLINEGGG